MTVKRSLGLRTWQTRHHDNSIDLADTGLSVMIPIASWIFQHVSQITVVLVGSF
jgi:hypothetical protein